MRENFIYRLILFGSHEKTEREISTWNMNIVDSINQRCFAEPLTGFLIIYPKHFIHLLEGPEISLNRYVIASAFDNNDDLKPKIDESKSKIDTSVKMIEKNEEPFELDFSGKRKSVQMESTDRKIVLGYFAVKERFVNRWNFQIFTPPQRQYDKEGFRKRLFRFVQSISVISVIAGRQQDRRPEEPKKLPGNDKGLGDDKLLEKQADEFLPCVEFLNYLLAKKKRTIPLRTPMEFIYIYLPIKNVVLSSDDDWPIPCRFAPYD